MRLMRRFLLLLSAGLLFGVLTWNIAAWAQDPGQPNDDPTAEAVESSADATTADEELPEDRRSTKRGRKTTSRI